MFTVNDFNPHGNFVLAEQGKVLLCKVFGGWNDEQAKYFVDTMSFVIANKFLSKNLKWARIMDMSEWQLSTPEANQIISSFIRWEDEHNCQMRCFCHCRSAQINLIKQKYRDSHNVYLFKDLESCQRACNLRLN
ncbi:hypothetical protein EAG18_20285 [Pseudoalteromonas sp. J010]|uniref:hypothetical protein n=1 Tax=Pseudoalteromonas sp. J010 TaxID=998465 RepID=UPI000F650F90|nr:hypothetical protein [Pseudoalteromonas sp. J010]RRS06811.1 hypothetical protein EAG18_20285 [Pseudoalteromonas sp. J010]